MLRNLRNFDSSWFDEFRRLEQEMRDVFEGGPWPVSIRQGQRRGYPPFNVGITAEQVDVYMFAAGLNPESLDVTLHQNLLTIKGQRNTERREGGQYHSRERYSGEFSRAVSLPDDVDADKIDAVYRDGVLRIRIARKAAVRPRKIEVQ